MVDHEAREQLQTQGNAINNLFKTIGEAAEKKRLDDQAAQQEKVKTTLIEIQSKIYDRASAYTNLVMAGGYAGSFATWAATRAQLTTNTNIAVALALTISLAAFIFFEVYKMTFTAVRFLKNRKLLVTPATPEQFNENLKKLSREEQKLSLFFMPIWVTVMFVAVGSALVAFCLLFYNYFAALIGWPAWPA